jgi:hypothetical protein
MRRQLGDCGQVKAAGRQHGQEHRMLPGRPGRGNPEIGLGLGEVQDARAVGEHRGECVTGIESSLVDLGDVGHHVGFDAPGLAHELGQAAEQLVVGDRLEWSLLLHDRNIGRGFLESRKAAGTTRRG